MKKFPVCTRDSLHFIKSQVEEKKSLNFFSFQYVLTKKWQEVTHSHFVIDFFFTSFLIHNHKLAVNLKAIVAVSNNRKG